MDCVELLPVPDEDLKAAIVPVATGVALAAGTAVGTYVIFKTSAATALLAGGVVIGSYYVIYKMNSATPPPPGEKDKLKKSHL